MAVLESGNLRFDFQFAEFDGGYITYHISLLWQGESVMNDKVFKRGNEYWDKRPVGGFLADEYREDYFVPFLRKILEDNTADYWESLDPDVTVAIYPDEYFPFLKSHWVRVQESEQQEREARLQRKKDPMIPTRLLFLWMRTISKARKYIKAVDFRYR
jgi:hypothetical protein